MPINVRTTSTAQGRELQTPTRAGAPARSPLCRERRTTNLVCVSSIPRDTSVIKYRICTNPAVPSPIREHAEQIVERRYRFDRSMFVDQHFSQTFHRFLRREIDEPLDARLFQTGSESAERPYGDYFDTRFGVECSEQSAELAATEPARRALKSKFEREVDPEGVLPPAERHRRAEAAAHGSDGSSRYLPINKIHPAAGFRRVTSSRSRDCNRGSNRASR
jgi:hypothetical protein